MAKRSFTLISRSAQSIISHLALFKSNNIIPASRKSLLFALSTNVASSDLGQLVDSLTTACASTVGCLSAPTHAPDLISCSVALFDHDECVPFRSEIPGTEIPQVGRWHSFRMKDEQEHPEELQWEDVWGKGKNKARSLPEALQPLDPLDVSSLLYFTDASPQGLISSLSSGFPNARRLGLIGSSTPFVTGRPYTLFNNNRIYDSGAVGLALTTRRPIVAPSIDFLGLEPLSSDTITVTDSEGNLVHTFDDKNAAQLLLNTIKKSGIDMSFDKSFKENAEFYLMTALGRIYTVTAGDPSRGTISLSGEDGPAVDEKIQFYHRRKTSIVRIPSATPSDTVFFVSDENHSVRYGDEKEQRLDGFVAASENGLVYGSSVVGVGGTRAGWVG